MRGVTIRLAIFIAGWVVAASVSAAAQEPVRLYAAGSLRVALTEVGAAFREATGIPVVNEFGASGLLRERIEKGAPADVFASADMGHPQKLSRDGKAGPVTVFTRNRLCGLAAPGIEVTSSNLLDVLLDTKVRLGSSTPKNDPSGDYAWEMFGKAEKLRPGAFKTLSGKALQLVGGRDAPPPPKNRSVYTELMAEGKADVFLTYCTNAILAQHESPGLKVVRLPEALAVGADYGLTVMHGAGEAAVRFSRYILSAPGQAILVKHGFEQVADKAKD